MKKFFSKVKKALMKRVGKDYSFTQLKKFIEENPQDRKQIIGLLVVFFDLPFVEESKSWSSVRASFLNTYQKDIDAYYPPHLNPMGGLKVKPLNCGWLIFSTAMLFKTDMGSGMSFATLAHQMNMMFDLPYTDSTLEKMLYGVGMDSECANLYIKLKSRWIKENEELDKKR